MSFEGQLSLYLPLSMRKLISIILRTVPRRYLNRFAHVFLRIIAIFYRGSNVTCPINGRSYRKFLPYGRINPRPNALCPDTLSLERHRLMWLYLKNKTDFFAANLKVLHIAPEVCFIKKFKAMENLDYTTADIESPLADVKMDIHQIPFDDNEFDVIFCNHVLEHVKNDLVAMQEMCRVMKPGGWGIMQVPFFLPIPEVTFEDPSVTDAKERERIYGQDDHVRLYGEDYATRLERAGFEVEASDFVNELGEEQITKYALDRNEVLFVSQKPSL